MGKEQLVPYEGEGDEGSFLHKRGIRTGCRLLPVCRGPRGCWRLSQCAERKSHFLPDR